jgi:DNA topoisomerase-1
MKGVLTDFYTPFKKALSTAEEKMPDIKREEKPTELSCEKCGSPMVIKWGKRGWFLACKSYPECKTTKDYKELPGGKIEIIPEKVTDEKCEVCGSPMLYKNGRFGEFLACSRYPECKATKAVSLGVTCPKPDCGGYLTEKR